MRAALAAGACLLGDVDGDLGPRGGSRFLASNAMAQTSSAAPEAERDAPLLEPLLPGEALAPRSAPNDVGAEPFAGPAAAFSGHGVSAFDTGVDYGAGSADFAPAALVPFDWVRHFGFRHSSTHGRHVDRGIPLERTSWLNRPFHVDWFAGPLVMNDVVRGRVRQGNDFFGGLRAGWDFDYYWGIEWRIGWSDPNLSTTGLAETSGNYMVSDVDVIYYPWGDSRVRPYTLLGLGVAEVGSIRTNGTGHEAVLVGMPFGGGIQFAQTRQIAWRLEAIDNMAFASDGISTQHNLSLTLGMELRLGARPNSYWPWRAGRSVW